MDPDEIRRRLQRILANTTGAEKIGPTAYWVGDKAEERRIHDDFAAGRVAWHESNRNANAGIDALNAGDDGPVSAEEFLWIATDFYIEALESRMRPEDRKELTRKIRRRGRPLGSVSKKGRNPQPK